MASNCCLVHNMNRFFSLCVCVCLPYFPCYKTEGGEEELETFLPRSVSPVHN